MSNLHHLRIVENELVGKIIGYPDKFCQCFWPQIVSDRDAERPIQGPIDDLCCGKYSRSAHVRAETIKETGRIRSPLGWYPPPGTSPNRILLKGRACRIWGRAGCVIADHARLVREKCALAGLSNGNRNCSGRVGLVVVSGIGNRLKRVAALRAA
jgi:hypothetical protein